MIFRMSTATVEHRNDFNGGFRARCFCSLRKVLTRYSVERSLSYSMHDSLFGPFASSLHSFLMHRDRKDSWSSRVSFKDSQKTTTATEKRTEQSCRYGIRALPLRCVVPELRVHTFSFHSSLFNDYQQLSSTFSTTFQKSKNLLKMEKLPLRYHL